MNKTTTITGTSTNTTGTTTPAPRTTVHVYRLSGTHQARSARALLACDKQWAENRQFSFSQTKMIWLPGNESYPLKWLELCADKRRLAGHVLEKGQDGPDRQQCYFEEDISQRTFDVLLNEGRSRSRRKMLPSFNIARTSFVKQFHVGSGEQTCGSLWSKMHIGIDEIGGLSPECDGFYAVVKFNAASPTTTRSIIDPDSNNAAIMIAREVPLVIDNAPLVGDKSPTGYYHSLAKNVFPKFPW